MIILHVLAFFAFSFEPTLYCFQTEDSTYGLPSEICLKRAHWLQKQDGSYIVNLVGPEIQAMMEEVLPTSKKASVTTSYINRYEECGTNIKSELFLENLDRKKDIDFNKVKVRVSVRYTEPICDAKWKTATIRYKLKVNEEP